MLRERIERVRQRIARSCARSGREPSSVTLVAVTKGVPVEWVRDAAALGLTDFGENRVQEALAKQKELAAQLEARGSRLDDEGRTSEPPAPSLQPIRWHLIGHLQRNKVRHAAEGFDLIHSADSLELIDALERAAAAGRPAPLEVLVQVNVSGEDTKFGCRPEEGLSLAQAVTRASHLRLAGFMTIAPFADDPELARPPFRRLRLLRDEAAAALGKPASDLKLSMGMSQDFEVAIEAGADIVRIGTAIFGTRDMGRGT